MATAFQIELAKRLVVTGVVVTPATVDEPASMVVTKDRRKDRHKGSRAAYMRGYRARKRNEERRT
jgi:hypothetical protein